jgi:preflagellin peptidase FlaK
MYELELILNSIRLILGILILLYASYTDIKTRTVSNKLWIIMILAGIIILVIQLFISKIINFYSLLFIPIMILLFYFFFQFRLLFGGADAKAIMSLTLLTPFTPIFFIFPINVPIMPFPWVIFSNSILIFIFIPLILFFYNLYKKELEFPFCFLGYKHDIKNIKNKFVWPLEKITNGKKKLNYIPQEWHQNEIFELYEKKGISKIWVTPKIPFMIPLLIGFIISFIFGDIIFSIISTAI